MYWDRKIYVGVGNVACYDYQTMDKHKEEEIIKVGTYHANILEDFGCLNGFYQVRSYQMWRDGSEELKIASGLNVFLV